MSKPLPSPLQPPASLCSELGTSRCTCTSRVPHRQPVSVVPQRPAPSCSPALCPQSLCKTVLGWSQGKEGPTGGITLPRPRSTTVGTGLAPESPRGRDHHRGESKQVGSLAGSGNAPATCCLYRAYQKPSTTEHPAAPCLHPSQSTRSPACPSTPNPAPQVPSFQTCGPTTKPAGKIPALEDMRAGCQ